MTWGSIRFALQTAAPDVALDLIDSWLNARYEMALEATDWTGLQAHTTIQTQAAYQSVLDTVTLTIGSAAVVGSGTTWTIAITGKRFYRPGDTAIYTATYVSGTSLTLDRPYEGNGTAAAGTVYAASNYVFMQNLYSAPSDCRTVKTILNAVDQRPMGIFSKDDLDTSVGSRATVGDPQSYCPYDDSAEASPPVVHEIEFYPPPLAARGYPLEYIRNANAFDGSNTSGSPLPFLSSALLLFGVRADIATHLKSMAQAMKNEVDWRGELDRLLLLEHAQRRAPVSLRMADRYTRHRLARVTR